MKDSIECGIMSFNHIVELYEGFYPVKSIGKPMANYMGTPSKLMDSSDIMEWSCDCPLQSRGYIQTLAQEEATLFDTGPRLPAGSMSVSRFEVGWVRPSRRGQSFEPAHR